MLLVLSGCLLVGMFAVASASALLTPPHPSGGRAGLAEDGGRARDSEGLRGGDGLRAVGGVRARSPRRPIASSATARWS